MKTGKELQDILKRASQSVREKAKATGAPLFYIRNGKRIREDSDGRIHILRELQDPISNKEKK